MRVGQPDRADGRRCAAGDRAGGGGGRRARGEGDDRRRRSRRQRACGVQDERCARRRSRSRRARGVDGRSREAQYSAERACGDLESSDRRVPVVRGQRVLDAHGEPDHSAELQSGRSESAVGAAVRRAVQPVVVLGRQSASDGRHHRPEARSARPRRPIRAVCRSTRTAPSSAASASSPTAIYTIDLDIIDTDTDVDELIAVAGTFGFAAPADRRANQITVDGRTLRYVDSESTQRAIPRARRHLRRSTGLRARSSTSPGYGGNPIVAGVAFGTPASGYRPDPESGVRRHAVPTRSSMRRTPSAIRRFQAPTACSRKPKSRRC